MCTGIFLCYLGACEDEAEPKTPKTAGEEGKLEDVQQQFWEQNGEVQNKQKGKQHNLRQNGKKTNRDVNDLEQIQDLPDQSQTVPGVSLRCRRKKHACVKCHEKFDTLYSLRCHRLSCCKRDKKYKCSHCDMSFAQPMQLKVCTSYFSHLFFIHIFMSPILHSKVS